MSLVLIPKLYLHAVVKIGTAMTTMSVLQGKSLAEEAAPTSHGNPLIVHFFVIVST